MANEVKLNTSFSDVDYIQGIVHDRNREMGALYKEWVKYFKEHFKGIFFGLEDSVMDICHDSFLVLVNNVRQKKIYVEDGILKGREGKPFTSTLLTYMMAIAINKRREMVRDLSKVKQFDILDNQSSAIKKKIKEMTDESNPFFYTSNEQMMHEVIANVIAEMPVRCRQILTMFYTYELTLDQILEKLSQETDGLKSKDALKTRKNKCMNTLREKANKQYSELLNS